MAWQSIRSRGKMRAGEVSLPPRRPSPYCNLKGGCVMAASQPMPPFPSIQGVEFRAVVGFPGYCVGDDGSVWSLWVLRGGRSTRRREMSLGWKKMNTRTKSYPRVTLIDSDGGRRDRHVHVLVLEAFVGPCPKGMECRHLNDVPCDNNLSNLAWGTQAENWKDSVVNGHRKPGEGVHNAKATVDLVLKIRAARDAGETLKSIASWSGMSWQQVHAIGTRRAWRHV